MTSFAGFPKAAKGFAEVVAKNVIGAIVGAITAALLLVYGVNYFTHHAYTITTAEQVTTLLMGSVENAHDFITATNDGKATVTINKEAKMLGIPIGDSNLVYEGVGKVRAGIDLEKVQVKSIDAERHSIHVILPAPHISDVSLNVDRSSTLANYRNWFGSQAGPELYDQAQRKAIAQIREEACANNILNVASHNAEEWIRSMMSKAAFQSIQVERESVPSGTCPIA